MNNTLKNNRSACIDFSNMENIFYNRNVLQAKPVEDNTEVAEIEDPKVEVIEITEEEAKEVIIY